MEIRGVSLNNPVTKNDSIPFSQNTKTDDMVNNKNINKKDLQASLDKANKVLFKNNTHLKFEIHEKTKDVMVKLINDETGETLKEFPPEKILDMVAKLWEIAGIFVDEKR